jgi:hypothetical protein
LLHHSSDALQAVLTQLNLKGVSPIGGILTAETVETARPALLKHPLLYPSSLLMLMLPWSTFPMGLLSRAPPQ